MLPASWLQVLGGDSEVVLLADMCYCMGMSEMTVKEFATLGGNATKRKHGREHYVAMANKAVIARKIKKQSNEKTSS